MSILTKKIQHFPLTFFLVSFIITTTTAQNVGIGTLAPDGSAKLHIESNNSGFLAPRVALANVTNNTTPVNNPAIGLMVWNTNAAVTGGNGIGFYCWDGSQWLKLVGSNSALPTQDHDFYEVGTTTAPNAITDNIFTMGNVGLGTNTPTKRLDVLGGSTSLDDYIYLKDFDDATESTNLVSRDNAFMVWTGGWVVGQYADGAIPAGFGTTGSLLSRGQSAFAVNSGNVGIGNTTPEVKLDVRGNIIQWANRSSLGTDQGGSMELGASNGVVGLGTPYIDFHYNGLAEDFNTRIINDGNGQLTFFANNRSIFSNGVRMAGLPASVANTSVLTLNGAGDLESRTIPANVWDGDDNTTYTAGTGLLLTGTTFSNTTPDQVVALTGTGATTISGTYPNFTINSTDNNTTYTAGTGLTLTGTVFSNDLGTSIESSEITNGTIVAADLNQMGATANQVLSWNGATWTPTNPLVDHDWYEVGGTTAPDNINDNKYTFGKIGIGLNNPVANLHIVGVDGVLATGTFGSGMIPATGAGTRMMWYPSKAAFRTGFINGTQWDDANIGNYSVAFGYNNTASNQASTVFGDSNTNSGQNSSIGGGSGNNVSGVNTVIAGGSTNTASSGYTVIGGGQNHNALADYTTIAGGRQNRVSGVYDAVLGGQNNSIYSVEGYNTIGGGGYNTIPSGIHSTISGGRENTSSDNYNYIGGGIQNRITGTSAAYSSIVGGRENTVTALYCIIGGGYQNILGGAAFYSGVFSGRNNTVTTSYSGIVAGSNNNIVGSHSLIGAGQQNYVQGGRSFLGAGQLDTITSSSACGFLGAGYDNNLDLRYSVIVGGIYNSISGDNSASGDSAAFIGAGRGNSSYFSNASVIVGGVSNSINTADFGVVGGGQSNTINARHGVVSGGSNNSISTVLANNSAIVGGSFNIISNIASFSFIGGGVSNNTLGAYSVVAGGASNIVGASNYGTISGGRSNSVMGNYGSINGGQGNDITTTGTYNTVGAGYNNDITSGSSNTIGGGYDNLISITNGNTSYGWSTIAGGYQNQIVGSNAEYSSIVGGRSNMVTANYNLIGGGQDNVINGAWSVIAGGRTNLISGAWYNGILAGTSNSITGLISAIGAGQTNIIQSGRSFIGAGERNTVTGIGEHSVVGAGYQNTLDLRYSVIGGGFNNRVTGSNVVNNIDSMAFIGAGRDNLIYFSNASSIVGGIDNEVNNSDYASIVGGENSTILNSRFGFVGGGQNNNVSGFGAAILAGVNNTASGQYSFVGVGRNNTASGHYSVALGYYANTNNQNGSFVFSDATSIANTTATAANQFMVRAAGGTIFYSNGAMTTGVQLAAGGGAWATISDKNKKENFEKVEGELVLTKIAKMPITSWNYISQDDKIRHLGPMAQDFYAAFQLGESDTTITTTDIDGISLLAIQSLEKRSRLLQEENKAQAEEINELKALLQQQKNQYTASLESVETRLKRLEYISE